MTTKPVRYGLIALLGLGMASLVYYLHQSGITDVERIQVWVDDFGLLGPVVFGLLYIAISLTGLSTAALTILAGTLFSLPLALLVVVFFATCAAMIAFYLARYLRQTFVNENLPAAPDQNALQRFVQRIEDNAKTRGFMVIALMRLSFLPYIPVSYAAGAVKNLKARDFLLATFLTNIFGSFVFIFLGKSLTESWPLVILAIILLIAFLQLPQLIKRYQHDQPDKR